ncbi:leucine-rich repeat-containing protein kinase family protein [Paeniroseomonas aquatica]|uniref:Leucine-rich repeat-containing protein kinase family protein n=1 Tax=Paeniroseomonas aquatica TaxID=373043 RepID=A0ABT8A8S9_9PROT|nr:leucine-rich repeat-containing protein kinase family protein [Paeniroseomonas aquatica]MDN3565933.1 leucine-rich repeat-containing protein kinase family protein [Paeniroseomonas aquatica]
MRPDALHALRRGDLAGARSLRLAGLGLTEFPAEILGLADTLELLDLSGNALAALPPSFGRLRRLRVFFGSGNRFGRLPPVLGDCLALSQLGCRGSALAEVPAEALPPALRWLTLTDNHLASLPAALGERPALQKLMLSGNRLDRLPEGLAGAGRLELLRIAANRFATLPPWVGALPSLAWLAMAGNPCEGPGKDPREDPGAVPAATPVAWSDLVPGALLGEGASGRVHAAAWDGRPVALKLFKGAMTSDGLPEREMAACLAAGGHPNLIGALGRLTGHPEALQGLVMPLLPVAWRVLAGPPSLESCSRDVYDPALRLDAEVALRLARGIGAAAAHLHGRGLLHGDLYAHNVLWDGTAGAAVLSDLGAAACLPSGALGERLQRIEVRAWGLLLGELLDRCAAAPAAARAMEAACVQPEVAARPLLAEALAMLPAA